MPDQAFGFGTPFAEQIAFLRAKLNLPTERWDDITRAAHDRAFIVAGAAKADLLTDLRGAVDQAVQGGSLGQFRKDFDRIVAAVLTVPAFAEIFKIALGGPVLTAAALAAAVAGGGCTALLRLAPRRRQAA